MHEYKYVTKCNSADYPGIDFQKLRIGCIANFRSIHNIVSSHIKCCGKTAYTRMTSVPIIKTYHIKNLISCILSLIH